MNLMFSTSKYQPLGMEDRDMGSKLVEVSKRNLMLLTLVSLSFCILGGYFLFGQSSVAIRYTCLPDSHSSLLLTTSGTSSTFFIVTKLITSRSASKVVFAQDSPSGSYCKFICSDPCAKYPVSEISVLKKKID